MNDASVLVTGGAGYIGNQVAWALFDAGRKAVVIDNLSAGRRELIPDGFPLVVGDVGDTDLVRRTLRDHRCGAVMHFAASIVVPESVEQPLAYYRNNTCASRALIEAVTDEGVENFIFSSTAAVYGDPDAVPVAEDAPTRPANPYGTSKLMCEWILRDTALANDFRYVALRYFNVAGADIDGRTGQCSPDATHLIKTAVQTAVGLRGHMSIYGADYDTPDGTPIRDYIHPTDLAAAHLAALEHLEGGGDSQVLNCGYGRGFSVREVLDTVADVAGKNLDIRKAPRRPGDVARLIADPERIRRILGWRPRHDDLGTIVRTALDWEKRLMDTDRG